MAKNPTVTANRAHRVPPDITSPDEPFDDVSTAGLTGPDGDLPAPVADAESPKESDELLGILLSTEVSRPSSVPLEPPEDIPSGTTVLATP